MCCYKVTVYVSGIHVGGSMSPLHSWSDVIQEVSDCLSKWRLKTLSIGSRLTLLTSVLGSVPTFYLSLFKSPTGILVKLESLSRNIFFSAKEGKKK